MKEIYGMYDVDGSLRYIGKADHTETRLKSHIRDSRRRTTPFYVWLKGLIDQGIFPKVEILAVCLYDDWEWAEIELIRSARARGENLLNIADGGNKPKGPPHKLNYMAGVKAQLEARKDPAKCRVWTAKRMLSQSLKQGCLSEKTKNVMRYAAGKRPDLFGDWKDI